MKSYYLKVFYVLKYMENQKENFMNKKLLLILVLAILAPLVSWATHLRAGEITATRVSSSQLTYKITLTTYTDQINGKPANDGQETVTFNFGFSTTKPEIYKVSRKKKFLINPATMCNVYDTTITFPAPGQYTISCGIVNRNERTINLPQPSENISFFVQTSININPSFGLNSTPVLLNIPIDSASLGSKFIHNPGAFDIDGDSLSYRLTTPKRDKGTDTGVGEFIEGYLDPSTVGPAPILNEAGSGPATFRIDPRTGDLIWDAPREIGQYNVAFIIEEWRKAPSGNYLKIGEIVRDMQIIVVESTNKRPLLEVPDEVCVEAGKRAEFEVKGKDQDDQSLKLTSSGGVYNLDASGLPIKFIEPEAATFKSTPANKLVTGTFAWNTNCLHVRDQPYDVLFKVEDSPGRFSTSLVDIKTMKITVLPPTPKDLVATEQETGVKLTWKAVTGCKTEGKILVYRKNGCSGLNPGECIAGMPADWGYTLLTSVNTSDTTYTDLSTEKGAIYSYRLVTEIPVNSFVKMQSSPSIEFCVGSEIKKGMNVITKVSIDKTDPQTGEITINWTKPIDFDSKIDKGPYAYKLLRTIGLGGESFELVHTQVTAFDGSVDTLFVDKGLNTKDNIYRYKVEFYTESEKLYSTSPQATSVRLDVSPEDKKLKLKWEANVPWKNDNQVHLIYREDKQKAGSFNLIKKLEVGGISSFTYIDEGKDTETDDGDISVEIQNKENYCYYVITRGLYEELPLLGLLQNASQIACGSPADNTPPCKPDLVGTPNGSGSGCEGLTAEDFCNNDVFVNKISWNAPASTGTGECRQDVISYSIFYSRYEDEEPRLIAVQDAALGTTFNHKRNSKDGFAGCYYISAKSNLGGESTMSNKICFDNCEDISFPNVFSPNGDGKNDTFSPMNCPAFINTISYDIFASTGLKVATGSESSLDWDGRDSNGKLLPTGVYYYLITVKFEKLSREGSIKTFKGYISLLR